MQTFLPYPDFKQSAKCLDNKRLGKQRVECLQILNCLLKGEYICKLCNVKHEQPIVGHVLIKTPWYNHPAVQMWKGYETALAAYGIECCIEWKKRGFKDTCEEKIWSMPHSIKKSMVDWKMPKWLGNEKFHLSHKSKLIQKKPEFYRPIFGVDTPNDLSYYWPTKENEY